MSPSNGHIGKKLVCPDGHELEGTLETLPGCAYATAEIAADGTWTTQPDGYTDIWWGDSQTVQEGGEDILVCVENDQFRSSKWKVVNE